MPNSNDYWDGYDDARCDRYRYDRYIHNTQEKDDYIKGYGDSESDKANGVDQRS